MFHCERCQLPLRIHSSLDELSAAQTSLLVAQKTPPEDARLLPELPRDRRATYTEAVTSARPREAESFVLLPDPQPSTSFSHHVEALSGVFELLSASSEVDYPVCSDCVTLLVETMKTRFDACVREKDTYVQFLRRLREQPGPVEVATEEASASALEAELAALEAERRALEAARGELEREAQALEKEEQASLRARNQLEVEVAEFRRQRDAAATQYATSVAQLDRLRSTSIYDDVFRIAHDGPFGTINGLRLGSLPREPVSWNEINAALGQLVLLLATRAAEWGVALAAHRLRPMGSQSRIERVHGTQVTVLECFSSGEYTVERVFSYGKFDSAMVALVEVVRELWAVRSARHGPENSIVLLPYAMEESTVGGKSVKLGTARGGDEWTMACKFLLTNVKWLE